MSTTGVLAAVEAALADHFGHVPARASVSFVGVHPIEVLRFEPIPGELAFLTLGMSRQAMTAASEPVLESSGPRAELMVHVRAAGGRFADVWRQIAVLAASPMVEGVVYAAGMTVDLGQPIAAGSRCTGVVLTESPLVAVATEAGPVEVLLAVPATPTELAWTRVRGVAALHERWASTGVDLLDLGRSAARLE